MEPLPFEPEENERDERETMESTYPTWWKQLAEVGVKQSDFV